MWSRSIVLRLMAPVGMMLLLVCLLGLVGLTTRMRVHHSYDALSRSQRVHTDLTEARSLSRSLQRDALNLSLETDPAELSILNGKFAGRSADMKARLDALVHNPNFTADGDRDRYLRSQATVLDRLAAVAARTHRGDRSGALAIFRREVRPNEREASRIADGLIARQDAIVAEQTGRTQTLESQEILISALAGGILFLAAAAATLAIVRRSIVQPLFEIERELSRIAAGETNGRTPHVGRHDEIGTMARAIEVFRASMLDRERLLLDQERRRADEIQRELSREQARRLDEEREAARSRAVARSAQALEAQVGEVLGRLHRSARALAATSGELSSHSATAKSGLAAVGAAVTRAAGGAVDIASATDQFMGTLANATRQTRRSADLGAAAADQSGILAGRMARVQDHARTIGTVVDLISGIARRTNLLALNATIEAARAGEVGRGFAVVANEVKALANQTARATSEVAGQIAAMQDAAGEAGDSLAAIESVIADLARGADLLATALDEQSRSGQFISRNVTGAAADLDLIDSRVGEVAAAAAGVDGLALRVQADAGLLEDSAAEIHGALSLFFGDLHVDVRADRERMALAG